MQSSEIVSGAGVITTPKRYYCDAADVMNYLGCKENKAYKILRALRKELIDAGKLTPAYPPGKIPKKYFIERCMVEE